MNYLWTEDQGAGLHFWQLVNQYLFENRLTVESKKSNQGLLDAVRMLEPEEEDRYYLAFDIVYDNMDIVNKWMELQEFKMKYPKQIILLDMTCFEYFILTFPKLIEWTGNGHTDAVHMREHILRAIRDHKIDLEEIRDEKTLHYLMGFRRYSTERVIKSMTYMLTDGDAWSVKGEKMGSCWHEDCCVLENREKKQCRLEEKTGCDKMTELLSGAEFRKTIYSVRTD